MEQFLNYILNHGPLAFIISFIVINIIGILKLCKAFNWIKTKGVKKLVYYILNVALTFAAVAIYYHINWLDPSDYLIFSFKQVGSTTALYAIYENLGLRNLWQIVLTWIISLFKKDPEHVLVKSLKKLGLTEEAIQRVQMLTNSELELKANAEQEGLER